jgi:GH15 family glucan-1,4-alpha-glucosidase
VSERPKMDAPLHAARIEDYALIGNCETAALVSSAGSIDWLCLPSFSSPACFAALLGTADHGYWKISPADEFKEKRRRYVDSTMVLETSFVTEAGEVSLIDFMPPGGENTNLVRLVKGVRGSVDMRADLALRFDYGRTVPWVTQANCELHAVAGPDMLVLRSRDAIGGHVCLEGQDHSTFSQFMVNAGETVCFALTYCSSLSPTPNEFDIDAALEETKKYWTEWTARCTYSGDYAGPVQRSLMALKAMTYRPTGGIVAAVTTSLPENRRRTQLGLSLLLAARYLLHAAGAHAGRLPGRGDRMASLAASRCSRGPIADPNHLRHIRRSRTRGVDRRLAARVRKLRAGTRR